VPETRLLDDGWTVVTQDGNIAAHFEHTVAVTAEGPWVLTAEDGGLSGLASVAYAAAGEPDHEIPVGARRA
jgi:methionyl aminopeptidase